MHHEIHAFKSIKELRSLYTSPRMKMGYFSLYYISHNLSLIEQIMLIENLNKTLCKDLKKFRNTHKRKLCFSSPFRVLFIWIWVCRVWFWTGWVRLWTGATFGPILIRFHIGCVRQTWLVYNMAIIIILDLKRIS